MSTNELLENIFSNNYKISMTIDEQHKNKIKMDTYISQSIAALEIDIRNADRKNDIRLKEILTKKLNDLKRNYCS